MDLEAGRDPEAGVDLEAGIYLEDTGEIPVVELEPQLEPSIVASARAASVPSSPLLARIGAYASIDDTPA